VRFRNDIVIGVGGIEQLRRMREQCEPMSNQNPRYLWYSNAVSALRWIIDDVTRERA
jgi:hypothetical protein